MFGESDEFFQKICNNCGVLEVPVQSDVDVVVASSDVPDIYILQQKIRQVSKGVSLRKTKARCQRSRSTKIGMPLVVRLKERVTVERPYIDPSSRCSLCLLRCLLPRVFACTSVSHGDSSSSSSSSSTVLGSLLSQKYCLINHAAPE